MTNLNLLKDNERKVFYHYLIPSICSTLVTSIYILVDTLIIGQGVGAEGISALNIFLPFFTIYNGIGLMFGLGGGILISIEDGIGNKKKADSYFNSAFIGVIIIGIIFTLLTNIGTKSLPSFTNFIETIANISKTIIVMISANKVIPFSFFNNFVSFIFSSFVL